MLTYVIAATAGDLVRNLGTEIIASSVEEAIDRYFIVNGDYNRRNTTITVKHPDGYVDQVDASDWVFEECGCAPGISEAEA